MANEIIASVKHPSGIVGPKKFLQAAIQQYSTASDSGIVPGSAVSIVNGLAVLALATASNTLAIGLVSKVISTTLCEVMTDGVFSAYPGSFNVNVPLYLSSSVAGSITTTKPATEAHLVQLIGRAAYFDNDTGTDIELNISGFSNLEASKLARMIDLVTGTVESKLRIGPKVNPVTPPQATLHVVGDGLISGKDVTSSLTLSRNDATVADEDELGRIDFCVNTTASNSPAAGVVGASIVATAAGAWANNTHATNVVIDTPAGHTSFVAVGDECARVSGTAVSLKKPTTIESTLNVDGAVGFDAGLVVAGGAVIGDTLGVVGAVGLTSTLSVLGNTTVGGGYGNSGVTVGAAGTIQADGTLTVDGTTTLTGGLVVEGTSSFETISVNSTTNDAPPEIALGYAVATITDNEILGRISFYAYETGQEPTIAGRLSAKAVGAWAADGYSTLHLGVSDGANNLYDIVEVSKSGVAVVAGTGDTSTITVSTGDRDDGLVTIYGTGLALVVNGSAVITDGVTPFTGAHVYPVEAEVPLGSAMVLVNNRVALSGSPRAKNCVGVFIDTQTSGIDSLGDDTVTLRARVAAVGDNRVGPLRGFLVCNENGPIASGDLLCTSSTPGHLMKQDDDILRAYTVGKAMQDVTFDESGKASGVYGYIYCG